MTQRRRARLLPWYIGTAIILTSIAIILLFNIVKGQVMPTGIEIATLTAIPVVHLTLMYLALTSQE